MELFVKLVTQTENGTHKSMLPHHMATHVSFLDLASHQAKSGQRAFCSCL